MLDRLTGKPVHATVHFIGCLGIAAGLPWSKVPLSLGTALLVINFLLSGNFKQAWENWKSNRFLFFFSIYLGVEFVSLAWTSDWNHAASDLIVKLPLFLLPFLICAIPFQNITRIYWIAFAFIAVCFITSFLNVGSYLHWWGNRVYDDFRGLSLFISHVRYALFIVFAMVLCFAWVHRKLPFWWIAVLLFIWFGWYTWFAQIIAGYIAFSASVIIGGLLLIQLFRKKFLRVSLYCTIAGTSAIVLYWMISLLQPVPRQVDPKELPKTTVNGRPYFNEITYQYWENGYPTAGSLCEDELRPAWNARSNADYETGKDISGNRLKHTMWRYMSSKGLTKDSLGFTKMSAEDIKNVENGIPSIVLLKGGLQSRIYTIQQQLEYDHDPNGHSLLERLEYWQAALNIIHDNWLTGVGMGDTQQAFDTFYERTHSKLLPENRHRAHNQYLTSIISSGVLGFIAFLIWWLTQLRASWLRRNFEWCCFVVICLGSFLTEDTLETQAGAVFVAFFFGIFTGNQPLFSKRL